MTVSNGKDGLRTFAGDGVTTEWNLDFPFTVVADLTVFLRDAEGVDQVQTINVHYTVSGTAEDMRNKLAKLVMVSATAVGVVVIVDRNLAAEQSRDFGAKKAIPAEEIEGGLDYMALAHGDQQRQLARVIKGDLLDTSGLTLPAVAARAGRILSFDALGAMEAADKKTDFVGPAFGYDARGTLAGRSTHDGEAEDFAYLATDQDPPLLYFRDTAVAGTWSAGVRFFAHDVDEASIIRVPAAGVSGTGDAIVITSGHLPANKTGGVKLRFVPNANNPGATTLEAKVGVASWGPLAVVDQMGSALGENSIFDNLPAEVTYSAELDKWVLFTNGSDIANVRDTFVGDGVQVNFIMSVTPATDQDVQVFIDGVHQHPDDWSFAGTTLTFIEAPANTAKIVALIGNQPGETNVPANGSVTAAKIAGSAVGTPALANGSVTTEKTAGFPITRKWISPDIPIAFSDNGSAAHGLGGYPSSTSVWLECVIAEHGYVPGQRLQIPNIIIGQSIPQGLAVAVTDTHVLWQFGSQALTFGGLDFITGALINRTNANWKIIIEALA